MEVLEENIVGRILNWDQNGRGEAELASDMTRGDLVFFRDQFGNDAICRIEKIFIRSPATGPLGRIDLIARNASIPRPMSPIYLYTPPILRGALLDIGRDEKGNQVKVRVNSLFQHTLITGKTTTGKSHLALGMAEALCERRIPHLIIDPQGEFSNLDKFDKNAHVVTETTEILDLLKRRQTVVLNLIELGDKLKVEAMCEAISVVLKEKEAAYNRSAKKNLSPEDVEFPPLVITVDEAEIFGPGEAVPKFKEQNKSRSSMVDIVKRRAKFGVGLIAITQRMKNFSSEIRSQCRNIVVFNMTDPSDLQTIQIFSGQKIPQNEIQSLKQGQAIVVGNWVDFPVRITTQPIKTARTKSLDFETMLGLDPEEFKPVALERRQVEQSQEEEVGATCSDCRKHCIKVSAKPHERVMFSHVHYKCPQCQDEWCTKEERWVK